MKYIRIFACILILVLFTGCTENGLVAGFSEGLSSGLSEGLSSGDDEAGAVDQEAIDREKAEIEEVRQAAREKLREEKEEAADGDVDAASDEAVAEAAMQGDAPDRAAEAADVSDRADATEAADKGEAAAQADASAAMGPEVSSSLRFRNRKLLDQHYTKHGIEMGFGSAAEYEAAAAAVVTNPNALHKTEAEDGDDVYYIPASNEFVVVSVDGYIRTYFKPDSGMKYYNKQ